MPHPESEGKSLRKQLVQAEASQLELNQQLQELLDRFPKANKRRKTFPPEVLAMLERIDASNKRLEDLRTRWVMHKTASCW